MSETRPTAVQPTYTTSHIDFVEFEQGYELVVGLEVHVELATATKLFSASPNRFGDEPNTVELEVEIFPSREMLEVLLVGAVLGQLRGEDRDHEFGCLGVRLGGDSTQHLVDRPLRAAAKVFQ